MNRKHLALLGLVAGAGVAAGFAFGPSLNAAFISEVRYVGHGSWNEPAASVAEQARRADVIVRARVVGLENRVETERLPLFDRDGKVIDEREFQTAYTDSTWQVLETLKGEPDSFLTVLQTGGTVAEKGLRRVFEMSADPLFVEGAEHVLFLLDVSADEVHGRGRKIYRVVNPLGRYEVEAGGRLVGPDSFEAAAATQIGAVPRTLEALTGEIGRSLDPERGRPVIR